MEKKLINDYVTTISNNSCLRRSCIKIRDQFHEKNVDCFRINGKWISKHFNNIALDEETNGYNFITKLFKAAKNIQWDEHNNCYNIIYAYTSKPLSKTINVYGFNKPILVFDDFFEDCKTRLKPCKYSDIEFLDGRSNFNTVIPYDANRDNYDNTISLKKAKLRKYSDEEIRDLGILGKSFKTFEGIDYTFGVEIETCDGLLTKNQAQNFKLNVMTDKDGSVYTNKGKKYGGAEYITGVLHGDEGLRQLKILCKELSKKTIVNKTCSVHVHIGTEFDNQFILYAYLLAVILEKDMFSIVSKNRGVNDYGEINVYCKPFQQLRLNLLNFEKNKSYDKETFEKIIKQDFNSVFQWVSGGYSEDANCNRKTNHPKGAKCGYDKNSQRYCWLNLVPTYFNTRGNQSYTIEFRLLGETTNYYKIRNWLLLCFAFVSFVKNRRADILNGYITQNGEKKELNIFNVLQIIYPNKGLQLANYFMKRKEFFNNNSTSSESDFYVNDISEEQNITINNIISEANKACV